MLLLVAGLVVFLGAHALTMQRAFRADLIARFGEMPYKVLYSLVSLAGFLMIIWGYGAARASGYIQIWNPPAFLSHVTAVLMLFAFVALIASYAPLGKIKSTLKHPMLTSVKAWALGHLLVNGDLATMLLATLFLAWAVMARINIKSRPNPDPPSAPWGVGDAIALGGGIATTFAFIYWLHPLLIGVPAVLR